MRVRFFRSYHTGITAVFDRNDRCTGMITRTGLVMAHPDVFTVAECSNVEEWEELALVAADSLPPEGYTILLKRDDRPNG